MKRRASKRKPTTSAAAAAPTDPRYAQVVAAFSKKRNVTRETRQGFGSGALKVNGRIFAMMTPRGEFVVKLPRARVDELVRADAGDRFEPGPGRVMKEWIVVRSGKAKWLTLAREAWEFTGG
jgi:hypothetical protein